MTIDSRKRVVLIALSMMGLAFVACGIVCSLTAHPALYWPMWAAIVWALRNLWTKGREYWNADPGHHYLGIEEED